MTGLCLCGKKTTFDMKMSDTHIMDNISQSNRERTVYIDSGDFGKIMIVTFMTIKNKDGYVVEWLGVIFCSDLATKMSKKMGDIYDAYTKSVVENNYEETITPLMTTPHVSSLFIIVEEYILERLFNNGGDNDLNVKAESVAFIDDKPNFSISESIAFIDDKLTFSIRK